MIRPSNAGAGGAASALQHLSPTFQPPVADPEALCSSLLAALQAWTEFLSSHAYVDIALSSHSYGLAASKAAELLRSHAALVSVLSLIAWFLHRGG